MITLRRTRNDSSLKALTMDLREMSDSIITKSQPFSLKNVWYFITNTDKKCLKEGKSATPT